MILILQNENKFFHFNHVKYFQNLDFLSEFVQFSVNCVFVFLISAKNLILFNFSHLGIMGTKNPYQMQKCGDDVGLPENAEKNIAARFNAICLFLTS